MIAGMVTASTGAGSALSASTSTSKPGQPGTTTRKPRSSKRAAQCSQLRGVTQKPWTRTMVSGAVTAGSSGSDEGEQVGVQPVAVGVGQRVPAAGVDGQGRVGDELGGALAAHRKGDDLVISLEQSIIQQRLNGVRTDLSAARQRYSSIAATARAWGFTNPSFFGQRFRQAFGVTPRQWRAGTRTATAPRT